MYSKSCTFVVLTLCFLTGWSDAQECVPKAVDNLTVSAHHTLTWTVNEEEECDITEFMVRIWQRDNPREFSFSVNVTEVDVSFLDVCEEWTFFVQAISDHTEGHGKRIHENLPIPIDANLTIAYINITQDEEHDEAHLHWAIADSHLGNCSLKYRLTIEQAGSPAIEDLYLDDRSIDLHFLSPCTLYEFGIRAINVASPTVEGPERLAFHNVPPIRQGPPLLVSVDASSTVVNTTWRLQSYVRNPCPVTEFRLEGNGLFNQTVKITDSRDRPAVNVTIDSLEPNSMYFIEAYVHNAGGWSNPNTGAFQTLE